jgi:CHASE2 domain-containing sensor protein/nitrogen-specific signal transduction histidine kinase
MPFFDERWRTAVILMLAGALVSFSGALFRLDNLLYDLGQRLASRPPPADIVIVAIDEESLSQLGRWPWSRRLHAALIDRLAAEGARLIALDLVFAEPDTSDPPADSELARAVAASGRVVLPLMLEQSRLNGQLLEVLPLPALTQHAAALGRAHAEIEEDGIARGLFLREGLGAARWPHFAEAMQQALDHRHEAGAAAETATRSPFILVREAFRRVPFLGPPGYFQTLSYAQVLTGRYPAGLFKDRIVLVGATATGLGDRLPTPVSGLSEPMPGVEFHANAFEAIRQDSLIRNLPRAAGVPLTMLLSVLPVFLLARLSPRQGLLASMGLLALVAGAALALPRLAGVWFEPAGALLAILIAYPVWSWRRLEAAGRFLDMELCHLAHDLDQSAIAGKGMPEAGSGDPFQARILQIQAAAQRVRALRNLIDRVLEGMPHGVVAVDRHGHVRLVNQRAQAWLGIEKDSRLPPGLKNGESAIQHEMKSREGIPLLVDEADFPPAMGIARVINLVDIAEVKRLEAERRETLAFLSHDIRAPLAMAVEQMASARPSPEALARLRTQLARAQELAEEFLATSRAELADEALFQDIDLAGLLHQAADAVYPQAQSRRITLVRDIPADPVWVKGEFGLLERMAVNLIQNAVKYSPDGSRVWIALEDAGEAVRLSVADSGPGVPEAERARLFRRFSRLAAAGSIPGAGLGLYFVRVVAEKHRGLAGVENAPQGGARFWVRLPRQQSA